MANDNKTTSRKPRRWLRWIGYFFGFMIVGLLIGYFVGTSEWALKSIILPRASKAMNAQVTVDGANISPFSTVTLRGLKVETKGTEPLVTAQEVRLRYKLMDIIKGNINVNEVTLQSPVITLVTFADGTSNLDPLTKQSGEKKPDEKKPTGKKDEKPPQLNLGKFALNNATIRKIDQRKDGTRELLELTGVNITAEDIGNNKVGQLGLAANVRLDQGLSSSSNGVLAATVGGKFNLQLDAALKPQVAKGRTQVAVTEAKGTFAQVAGLGVTLNTDVTPTQLNDVSVRFAQNGNALGALTVSGPFNAETMEGKLAVAVSQIDRQVLNLAGAAMGIDFNKTTINSSNTIELTQKGKIINVNGQLLVGNFSATQKGQTTPPLDVRTGYAVTYDDAKKTVLVQTFTLNGTQNNAEFLRGTLAKPMLLELGKATGAVDESAFDLIVTNFNLPDWQAFIGTNATISSGKLGVALRLVSQQAGKKLALNLTTELRQLTAAAGSNRVENADLVFSTRGAVTDFNALSLEQFRAELSQNGQQALLAGGAVQYNVKSQDADVQANLETSLPQVASLVSVPGLSVSSGTVKFAGHIVQKNTTPQQTNDPVLDRSVVGKLNVDNFTGAFESNRFDRFVTAIDVDLAARGDNAEIRKLSGTLRQSEQPGGSFEVAGNYNTAKKSGEINAQLLDLNQNVLKSFLAAALGDKQLESIVINSKTTAKLDGPTDMAVKTELHVANLVVNDPSGQVPKTPLGIDLNADLAQVKGVVDLKNVQLALAKTERAPNSLNVAGRIDMSKSNAWTGNLKITSDGMDVTPYYDLFAKKQTNGAVAAKPETSTSTSQTSKEAKTETEPPPVTLPFTQFISEVNIAKFFLREIAISNLVSKTTIENGRVNVNPFSLTLNGAPVSVTALMNLGVTGYEYDVNANLNRVPVEPLANTFMPEQRGIYKGNILSSVVIKGAGVTGPSLQKNLNGAIGFTLTNAEVKVADARFENRYAGWLVKWLPTVAKYLQVPELMDTPVTLVDSQVQITNGVAHLRRTFIESPAFQANVPGSVTLNEVMTNSTLNKLPVQLSLRRSIAEMARLAPKGGEQTPYVELPSIVFIEGTVGRPKYDLNEKAVLQLIAKTASGFIKGDAGNLLRGLGNLGSGTSTNASGTNVTSTNTTGNLIQGLGNLFQKQPKTNAPAATTPANKNKFKLNDLLK